MMIKYCHTSGPLQLPLPYPQYTSNSSGIRSYMTRKLDATGVNWTNNGKSSATLIVIPSIRFSKLIIHHLSRRHRFHPRPDSLLHLANEEPVFGYLKFSAKGCSKHMTRDRSQLMNFMKKFIGTFRFENDHFGVIMGYGDYVIGCSKHMTRDRSQLMNFMKKFIRTVRFENDHFGVIMGYGDYVIGNSVISRVYYVEGLGHNLFSVGQFCDSDLEVAFRKHSCYVQDTDGVDLIKGSRRSNLYTISIEDMMNSSPI
nr:integrase, catalytic region, zinc finger, CCHC-type, peptidase aspartic, catalytic [Tanacetum cinerariifolium]